MTGCSSSTGTVSGKVYYKNAPLKGGHVAFVAADKRSSTAEIKEDGSYTIEKLAIGEATISVETKSLKPPDRSTPQYAPPPGMQPPGGYAPPDRTALAKRYVAIPDRYADAEKSGLKYTVVGGKQEHDIKLD
jgi:hypothetical protein